MISDKTISNNGDGNNSIIGNGNNIDQSNNYYQATANRDMDDLTTISEIYLHLLKNRLKTSIKNNEITEETRIEILDKLKLNFNGEQFDFAKEKILKLWPRILQVQDFIRLEVEKNENNIDDLIGMIRADFCNIKKIDNHKTSVDKITIISEMAKNLLPSNKMSDPLWRANAEAILLYFFHFCDFGKKQ